MGKIRIAKTEKELVALAQQKFGWTEEQAQKWVALGKKEGFNEPAV
jgi:hypothetical protein